MIFVTVGTIRFDELIEKVYRLSRENKIQEEVIFQIAGGSFIPEGYQYFRMTQGIDKYIESASLIIGTGGAGTVLRVINKGKPFISVPNWHLARSHQAEIVKKFDEEGYLVWCKDLNLLDRYIKELRSAKIKLKNYQYSNDELVNDIRSYIDSR